MSIGSYGNRSMRTSGKPASLRRLFRRAVGVSPSVYRRRCQPLFRLGDAA
jgi:hypothetical protein